MDQRRGFSLVELSIVLVILGLLVGGVLSGQALIRASELRVVTSEYQRYSTAIQSFRDKYFALPGDMANATSFWGKDNAQCSGNPGTVATPGTCNGNGNGIGEDGAGAGATAEVFRLWQHLALAGLIEGAYTGNAGPAYVTDHVVGTNSPRSKLSNAGWGTWDARNFPGDSDTYTYDYGQSLDFGVQVTGQTPWGPVLKPEEAWNIDTKMDDGMPGKGRVIAYRWSTCATSSSASDYAGTYRLSDPTIKCALTFTKLF